jgi:acyl carrier protein
MSIVIDPPKAALESRNAVDEFLMGTIAAICRLDRADVSPETSLADIDLDSLNATALVVHVEAEYGCDVSPDEFVELLQAVRVGDLFPPIYAIISRAAAARRAGDQIGV